MTSIRASGLSSTIVMMFVGKTNSVPRLPGTRIVSSTSPGPSLNKSGAAFRRPRIRSRSSSARVRRPGRPAGLCASFNRLAERSGVASLIPYFIPGTPSPPVSCSGAGPWTSWLDSWATPLKPSASTTPISSTGARRHGAHLEAFKAAEGERNRDVTGSTSWAGSSFARPFLPLDRGRLQSPSRQSYVFPTLFARSFSVLTNFRTVHSQSLVVSPLLSP